MTREPYDWKAYLECQCGMKSHLIVLEYDESWGLTISIQLRQWRSFWARLWAAFKYVLKIGPMTWDSTDIQQSDIPKLEAWLSHAKTHGLGMFKE